jgi:hypothetical protein
MASGEGAGEKDQRSFALMEDGAEADARGIAVHHERAIEVRHLEHGPRREHPLEGLECLIRIRVPGESITAQKARQWHDDEAEVPDVLSVVARETQEAT